MGETITFLLSHWPFIAFAVICVGLAQAEKGLFLTKKRIEGGNKLTASWLWWARKTLPLHPAIWGVIVGLVPGMPASEMVTTVAGKCLYFAGAGAASTWLFAIAKGIAKQRGFNLEASMPMPAPTANESPSTVTDLPTPGSKVS